MRYSVLYIGLLLLSINAFSQIKVMGVVKDVEGSVLPATIIEEIGTDNRVISDENGEFSLVTINDSSMIRASMIGMESEMVEITSDSNLTIILYTWKYESKWFNIGADYDFTNATVGLLISNGYNEHSLIHFEDFSQSWLYKVYGSTNFIEDFSFGANLARDYLLRYIYKPAIGFRHLDYSSRDFQFTDINFSAGARIKNFWGTFLFKTGYQYLNGNDNLGIGVGLQNEHYDPRLYYGLTVGYWFDYLSYNVYFQGNIYKQRLSIRLDYERIDRFDFLRIGLNYTFNRVTTTANKM